MQKENYVIMSKNFTLYDCNLASLCQQEDCEALNPRTISDQVYIKENCTLTDWIKDHGSGGGSSSIIVNPTYLSGLDLGTVDSKHFYVPFDWNQFKLDNDKIKLNLKWIPDNSDNEVFNEFVNIGYIKNAFEDENILQLSIPKPTLEYKINNEVDIKNLEIDVSLGNDIKSNIKIPKSAFDDLGFSNNYSLNINGNTVILEGTAGDSSSITFSGGIEINNDEIQHTNKITADNAEATINVDNQLVIPIIEYDSNGHITSIQQNKTFDISYSPHVNDMTTNGLSASFIDTKDLYTIDYWIPILTVIYDRDDVYILFEIFNKTTGVVGYGKFYLTANVNGSSTSCKLYCMEFATSDDTKFDLSNFKFVTDTDNNTITVYKKKRTTTDKYLINILSESTTSYRHYYFTGKDSSITDEDYKLDTNDNRVLANNAFEALNPESAINTTYYPTT